jgi:hypothetical protein
MASDGVAIVDSRKLPSMKGSLMIEVAGATGIGWFLYSRVDEESAI